MTSKYLIPLLTSVITACSIYPALGQKTTAPEITFTCEDNNDTPITIAKNKEGQIKTIFHWKEEAFKTKKSTPLELCDSVTKRLNEYADQEPSLSSFILTSNELDGLGVICASSKIHGCRKILFTLFPSEDKPSILFLIKI